DDLDKAAERLAAFTEEGNRALDESARLAMAPSNRETLAKAKELFQRYADTVSNIAASQRELIGLLATQAQRGTEWNNKMTDLMYSPALATAQRTVDITNRLRDADGYSKDARLAFWAYFARGGNELPAQMATALENTGALLQEADAL